MTTWITCPACGWNYEAHGDTHMSTRFNCPRSRSSVPGHVRALSYPQDYTPPVCSISLADADRQTEAVKKIMVEQKLEFGPVYDVYIDREQTRKLRAEAVARVKASGIFDSLGFAASHRPLFDKGDGFV